MSDEPKRRMPDRLDLGRHYSSTMAGPMGRRREFSADPYKTGNPLGLRVVMGFFLPTWQRQLVWTRDQKVKFIESAWRGLSLGTYTYNQASLGSPYDNLLIDGQQRMNAIEDYLDDAFPVFGYRWSDVTIVDRQIWEMSIGFASYVTDTEDERFLRDYYNLTNFGGTAHKENERA